MAFCNNCGSELEPEMKFCISCGTPVPGAAEQDQPVKPVMEAEQPVQQGSSPPPAPQQGSYTFPAPQQGSYTPPGQHAQDSYIPPAPSAGGSQRQVKPGNRNILIIGSVALVAVLAVVLIFILGRGRDKNGLPGVPADTNGGVSAGDSVQDIWSGTWYGYFWVTGAFGEWEGYEDTLYDSFMVIDVDGTGKGTMSIYLEDLEGDTVASYINAGREYYELAEGVFWDMDLDPDKWWVGLDPTSAGRHVIISDCYIDPELTEDDGFEFIFSFRPYGDKWSEEINDGSILPPGYDDYIKELSSRETGGDE